MPGPEYHGPCRQSLDAVADKCLGLSRAGVSQVHLIGADDPYEFGLAQSGEGKQVVECAAVVFRKRGFQERDQARDGPIAKGGKQFGDGNWIRQVCAVPLDPVLFLARDVFGIILRNRIPKTGNHQFR